jgi:hypothetical protein
LHGQTPAPNAPRPPKHTRPPDSRALIARHEPPPNGHARVRIHNLRRAREVLLQAMAAGQEAMASQPEASLPSAPLPIACFTLHHP